MEGVVSGREGLSLAAGFSQGMLETAEVGTPGADWLVPWWNADTSGEGSLEVFLQVGTAGGWSAWYPMGRWSDVSSSFPGGDENGKIETDTLVLAAKTDRFRLRILMTAGERGSGRVSVSRLGVIARDRASPRLPNRSAVREGRYPPLPADCSIEAPRRSQMVEAEGLRNRICSPSCLAMALESLGKEYATEYVAADCHDAGAGIYGNWPFNVASLWRLGARARLDFFPDMESATAELQAGRLLIASIRFGEGGLRGAPIAKTDGHLVLLRGITAGDGGKKRVLVNDPAAASHAEVEKQYDLDEFNAAWNGVAYVVQGLR